MPADQIDCFVYHDADTWKIPVQHRCLSEASNVSLSSYGGHGIDISSADTDSHAWLLRAISDCMVRESSLHAHVALFCGETIPEAMQKTLKELDSEVCCVGAVSIQSPDFLRHFKRALFHRSQKRLPEECSAYWINVSAGEEPGLPGVLCRSRFDVHITPCRT